MIHSGPVRANFGSWTALVTELELARQYAARLKDPATIEDVSRILDLLHKVVHNVTMYMIADWSTPDEEKKKSAIDAILERFDDVRDMKTDLLPMIAMDPDE